MTVVGGALCPDHFASLKLYFVGAALAAIMGILNTR